MWQLLSSITILDVLFHSASSFVRSKNNSKEELKKSRIIVLQSFFSTCIGLSLEFDTIKEARMTI